MPNVTKFCLHRDWRILQNVARDLRQLLRVACYIVRRMQDD